MKCLEALSKLAKIAISSLISFGLATQTTWFSYSMTIPYLINMLISSKNMRYNTT